MCGRAILRDIRLSSRNAPAASRGTPIVYFLTEAAAADDQGGTRADSTRNSLSMMLLRSRPPGTRGPLLVGLAFLSYATSLWRETFLLHRALGTGLLDRTVAAYAIASLIGNLYAQALGLIWIDGRRIPWIFDRFDLLACAGMLMVPISSSIGFCLILAALVGSFEYSRQRAAFRGRQPSALIAAIVAPSVTIACWSTVGIGSLTRIMAGYVAGYALQSSGAWLSSRHAEPNRDVLNRHHEASIIWPAIFAGVTQINGLLDRMTLALGPAGWAGAAAFSLNVASAAMVLVVGPLSSEAVAGRVRIQPSRRLLIAIVVTTIVGVALTPTVLPILISGGLVHGGSYDKVRDFMVVYLVSIPGAGYWLFRARAMQSGAHNWRRVTLSAGLMLSVHASIAVASLLVGKPLLAAVGWTVSSYVGALMLTTDS
jgi:hypothetical protein